MTEKIQRPVVAYYRVSTNRQGVSGLGLEAQQQAVRNYVRETNLLLVAEFTEVESGKVRERPQLTQALRNAAQLGATLVVAKLDRLARDAAFVLNLRASGVEFTAVDMPHANRMMIGMMALVAEYEGEQISARTKAALAAARERGVQLGGWRGGDGMEAITARGRAAHRANAAARRAKVLPVVQATLVVNDDNYNAAARDLNQGKVPTPSGRGEWHARQIKALVDRGEIPKPRKAKRAARK